MNAINEENLGAAISALKGLVEHGALTGVEGVITHLEAELVFFTLQTYMVSMVGKRVADDPAHGGHPLGVVERVWFDEADETWYVYVLSDDKEFDDDTYPAAELQLIPDVPEYWQLQLAVEAKNVNYRD